MTTVDAGVIVICPRECLKQPLSVWVGGAFEVITRHCAGVASNGKARCRHCGRYMPMGEVIDL